MVNSANIYPKYSMIYSIYTIYVTAVTKRAKKEAPGERGFGIKKKIEMPVKLYILELFG